MPPRALRSATATTAAAPATSTRSRSKNSGTSGAVKSQAPSSRSKRGRAKSGEVSKSGRKGKGRKKVISESEEEEEDKEDVVMAEGEAESEEEEVEIEEQREGEQGEGEKEQELVKELSSEMKRAVIRKKKTKITSVQHLEEDQQNDAAGPPKKLTKKNLRNSNISVAPPPHYHECSGTVTPASLVQASAPQDSFNFLSINMDDLFNDDESSSVFSHARQPLQIQEEMDFENQDVTETTPHKSVDKRGRSESPESPTMSFTSYSSKLVYFKPICFWDFI
ncbi:hypothetical protein BDQ17DRAFT_1523766 [Cyathus striatus]|nr:hypothetical protein BDQ17DRAFT_1523766 [Cyathus striatus]